MMILGFIQLLVIIIVLFFEYRNKAPIVFMWATLVMMFGIMHFISYFMEDYAYSENTLNEASSFVILFCIVYLLCRIMLRFRFRSNWIVNDEARISFKEKGIVKYIMGLLTVSVLVYVVCIIEVSGSLTAVSKANVDIAMAQRTVFLLPSMYLYYATVPIFLYFLKIKDYKFALLVAGLVFIRAAFSGSRMDFVMLFVGIISCRIIELHNDKKFLREVSLLGGLGVLAILAIYALRTFRYYYNFGDIGEIETAVFLEQFLDFFRTDNGELGLRQVFYFFVQNNNAFEGFGNGEGYFRVLLLPVPNVFTFGLKPEDMCVVMGRAWMPGFNSIINYTVTPTLFGDCYANFGFLGFLLGGFWASIGTLTEMVVNRKSVMLRTIYFGLFALEFIDIGRGSIYNPLCHMWYCGIIVAMVYFFSKIRLKLSW